MQPNTIGQQNYKRTTNTNQKDTRTTNLVPCLQILHTPIKTCLWENVRFLNALCLNLCQLISQFITELLKLYFVL